MRLVVCLKQIKNQYTMETVITTSIYAWMAFCAVSHVRIDAKKKGENLSFKSQGIWYVTQILFYWVLTSIIF
jgi:hypothetical protein